MKAESGLCDKHKWHKTKKSQWLMAKSGNRKAEPEDPAISLMERSDKSPSQEGDLGGG